MWSYYILLNYKYVYKIYRILIHFFLLIYFQGGEVVQETITSNVSDDIITLEFQRTDGTLVTLVNDFRNVSFFIIQNFKY